MPNEINYIYDYNLAHKYACGNNEAGEILYSTVYDALRKFVFSRTNNSKLSETQKEEIIGDSFLRSIEKINLYNGKSAFRNFVIGIASNIIKEKFRETKNGFLLYEDFPEFDENNIEDFYSKNPLKVFV